VARQRASVVAPEQWPTDGRGDVGGSALDLAVGYAQEDDVGPGAVGPDRAGPDRDAGVAQRGGQRASEAPLTDDRY
jgi:hypothetical protein